ncbi:MAG: KpsF/GutQ family sugar-phosphate isomerase [Rhizobiales bacterium]|nr:KpsF/GutQ family sugar-phosphate isomerase [Hyphomicrobiales bacterium]MBI3672391.1 KpsF/GutQ family sugar-phosphate isomerase [Hyphomicrobiales bacterium]
MSSRTLPNPVPLGTRWRASARQALVTETQGLELLVKAVDGVLGDAIASAVELIRQARGRVILTGMGKSGHVGRKIASTFASTGTPALFVHPAEASHGDLGMITADDVVLMISNSGESPELRDILTYSRRFAVPLIAITSQPQSSLAQEADIVLPIPQAREACPNGLAPTTSTLLQLALGDALAIALLEDKGFTARDFKNFHPGGKLGAQLLHVRDAMHKRAELPLATVAMPMSEALIVMTSRSYGCLGVVDDEGRLIGIITDGDLRRHMERNLLDRSVGDVMTANPKSIGPEALTSEALEFLNSAKITSLFVVDDECRPIGLVHIHDLLRIGAA